MATPLCPKYGDPTDLVCNVALDELMRSRHHTVTPTGQTWARQFVVTGTDSECDVEARLLHATLGILAPFQGYPLRDYNTERAGQYVWLVDAVYGYKGIAIQGIDIRPQNVSASTIGGTQHITAALYNVSWSPGCPLSMGETKAIEFENEAVKGIEIPSAEGRWREVWKFTMAEIFKPDPPLPDVDYDLSQQNVWNLNWTENNPVSLFDRWQRMVGWVHGYDWPVNVDDKKRALKFRGFHPGSLQFLGAQMSQLDDYDCEVTFEFAFQANEWVTLPTTIVDADDAPDTRHRGDDYKGAPVLTRGAKTEFGSAEIFKNGFDHIQFFYEKLAVEPTDERGEVVLPVARHYMIQQVVRYCPFQYLGVPVSPMYELGTPLRPACDVPPEISYSEIPCI